MLSFRYHLVSLVAAFLALAVGIVIGTTLADRAIVDGLRNRVDTVSANLDERQAANDRLQAENDRMESFLEESAGVLVEGSLEGQGVVVLVDAGLDGDAVDRTVALLGDAGALVRARVDLQPEWALDDADTRAALAEALGTEPADATAMRARFARLLVADLASSVAVPDDNTGAIDVAVDIGVVNYEELDEVVLQPDEQMAFVLITGTNNAVPGPLELLAEALVDEAVPAVAAEVFDADEAEASGAERGDVLGRLRANEVIETSIATVDDLDLPQGRLALILALEEVIDGTVGHYGQGSSVDRPAPESTPS